MVAELSWLYFTEKAIGRCGVRRFLCSGCFVKTQLRFCLGFIILAIAGVIFFQVFFPRPPDPVYQGKPLSVWLKNFEVGNSDKQIDLGSDAVRHIGTNALPMLISMIKSKGWGSTVTSVTSFINDKESFIHLPDDSGAERRTMAVFGFKALGPAAKPAIPELAGILFKQPQNFEASMAMADIGPDAIPTLVNALTNSDATIRAAAVATLGEMQTNAEAVVPPLIRCLDDKDKIVRLLAALSLTYFKEKSRMIVPAFLGHINDEDIRIRSIMIEGLGQFGGSAQIAIPAIRSHLTETNEIIRREARKALSEIETNGLAN